jgi:hypothetical protein
METFTETSEKKDECIELKNIKYKTMLMSGNILSELKTSNEDLTNLEKFLEYDKNNNKNEPWSKLDKTIKTQKMLDFAEDYSKEKKMTDEEKGILVIFLKDCLDRKKIQRVKDVSYDKTNGKITDIPSLFYNKTSKHFTLKNLEKRVNTLKSLPPKKTHIGTIKHKVADDSSSEGKK